MIEDLKLWGIIEGVKAECARMAAAGLDLETISVEAGNLLEDLIVGANGDVFDRSIASYFITEELYTRYGIAIKLDSEISHKH